MATNELDNTGGWEGLDDIEIWERWERLSTTHPRLFGAGDPDRTAWHEDQALTAEEEWNWRAAAYHWERLTRLEPNRREFNDRLAFAQSCAGLAEKEHDGYRERRRQIPPRSLATPAECVDLTPFFHEPAKWQPWLLTRGVPLGLQVANDITFDIRGLVNVAHADSELKRRGKKGSDRINDIPINRRCKKISFLHHASWYAAAKGPVEIVEVRVAFSNGRSINLPIEAGVQLSNDWANASDAPKKAKIALITKAGASNDHLVYHYTWENPSPDDEIDHLDIIAKDDLASYTLMAITVE